MIQCSSLLVILAGISMRDTFTRHITYNLYAAGERPDMRAVAVGPRGEDMTSDDDRLLKAMLSAVLRRRCLLWQTVVRLLTFATAERFGSWCGRRQ